MFFNSCSNLDLDGAGTIEGKLKDNFSILTINVRSIRGKFTDLLAYIDSFNSKFMFICLTEVCLDEEVDAGFKIPNYTRFSCFRDANGGGISVYVFDLVTAHIVPEKTGIFPTHESLLLKCDLTGFGEFYLWTIYRTPHLSKVNFCGYLETNLDFFGNKKLCVTGDFNLNLLEKNDRYVNHFINIMSGFDLRSSVDKPTFTSNESRKPTSCLDNFWHNFSRSTDSFVIYPPFSDHMAILLCIHFTIPKFFRPIVFRNFSVENKDKFILNLPEECNRYSMVSPDIDLETKRFLEWFNFLTDKYFPLQRKIVSSKRACAPWITTRIGKCIVKKHKWFKLFKAGLITYNSFKLYCSKLRYLLKCAEAKYYERRFNKLKGNPKKNWNLLKDLLCNNPKVQCDRLSVDDIVYSEPTQIVELFADYFAEIPIRLANECPPSMLNGLQHIIRQERSFFLFDSTQVELKNIIKKLKSTCSSKDIVVKVLKFGVDYFSIIISNLFNLSVANRKFPDELKIAKVTPIHKKGNRDSLSNYRPISILGNLNKIFEGVLYKRIYSYMEKFNLFTPSQFGFRKALGTEVAALHLLSYVLPAFHDNEFVAVIYLDYSKAFDTVQFDILLAKLDRLGIRGVPLQLLKSYLTDRKQYVSLKNCNSGFHPVSLGVPQGSSNGPLFFSLYINDLPQFLGSLCKTILYADDSTIILGGNDINGIEQAINQCLDKICIWSAYNKLSLNVTKSKAMIFSNRNYDVPSFMLYDSPLELVDAYKFLGVTFDCKLKFKSHVAAICSKLHRFCGITFRLKNKLNLHSARSFYFAYFHSVASYCISVWGGLLLCSRKGDRLCKLQDRIIKNLFLRFYPQLSMNELYFRLNLLKLPDVYRLRLATLMFKMLKLDQLSSILDLLNLRNCPHAYTTRQTDDYVLPFPRTQCIRESFYYQIIDCWNTLDPEIKNLTSLSSFKKACHRYYLDQYAD